MSENGVHDTITSMVRRIITSQRFYEILIPVMVWGIITMPLWLSPFYPNFVAFFIILYNSFFLYKTAKTAVYASIAYMRIQEANKINWQRRYEETPKGITHAVIITNYKESISKMRKTIDALTMQSFSAKQIVVVFAMEKAEGEAARLRSQKLTALYKKNFKEIITTYHTLLPHEVKGKASNETYAAKKLSQWAQKNNLNPESVIVTTCDADSILDRQYCSYVAYEYMRDKESKHHFFWAPLLLYSNYWQLNFFIRMQTTISSMLRLAFLAEEKNVIQISTYSMSLWLLESVGYWDVDIIPEDWHIFLQAFSKFGAKVRTKPIYLVTSGDGIVGNTVAETFKNRYDQEKRWAWGVTDIPYAINNLSSAHHISWIDKMFRIASVLETHLFWPSSFFILSIAAFIPSLVNPYFSTTMLGYLLPRVAGIMLTLGSCFILVYAYLDFQARRILLKKPEQKRIPQLLVQWTLYPFLSPIVSGFLSSIPALEAHTRMLLKKPIDYKVTKKV